MEGRGFAAAVSVAAIGASWGMTALEGRGASVDAVIPFLLPRVSKGAWLLAAAIATGFAAAEGRTAAVGVAAVAAAAAVLSLAALAAAWAASAVVGGAGNRPGSDPKAMGARLLGGAVLLNATASGLTTAGRGREGLAP